MITEQERVALEIFDRVLSGCTERLGQLGLVRIARQEPTENQYAASETCLYRQLDSNNVLRLNLSYLRKRAASLLLVYMVRMDGQTIAIDDYVRVHPETHLTREDFIFPSDLDTYEQNLAGVLDHVIGLLRDSLRPILTGQTWENVPVDFQGQK